MRHGSLRLPTAAQIADASDCSVSDVMGHIACEYRAPVQGTLLCLIPGAMRLCANTTSCLPLVNLVGELRDWLPSPPHRRAPGAGLRDIGGRVHLLEPGAI